MSALRQQGQSASAVRSCVTRLDGGGGANCSLEAGKEWTGGRLRLDEPSVIEPELHLGKFDRLLQVLSKTREGGQAITVVLKDVSKGNVVVVDAVALSKPTVWCMLRLDRGQQQVYLHDIMNGGESEKANNTINNDTVACQCLRHQPSFAHQIVQLAQLVL